MERYRVPVNVEHLAASLERVEHIVRRLSIGYNLDTLNEVRLFHSLPMP